MSKVLSAGGFTLVELMIAVAIIAIISAIAIPSYQSYITDSYRNQAAADVKVCALAMERYFSEDFTYVVDDGDYSSICNLTSPTSGTGRYSLTVSAAQTTFTIEAEPISGSCADNCIRLTQDGSQTIY